MGLSRARVVKAAKETVVDHLDNVMREFGGIIGIDELVFDDDECNLEIGDVVIDIVADRKRGALVLTAMVGDVPQGERTDALAYLLELNCGPTLGGAALGVMEGTDLVVLIDHVRAEKLDGAGLQRVITGFLSSIDQAKFLLRPDLENPMPEDLAFSSTSEAMIRV